MREPSAPTGKARDETDRSARLAAALRANLARRKAQARARTADTGETGDAAAGGRNDKSEG